MLLTVKTKETIIRQVLCSVAVFAALSISQTAHAETSCAVTPYTATIQRGGTATLSVTATLPQYDSAFDLRLGNLPKSVEGGFSVDNSIGLSLTKRATLSIRARGDAQIGSFMIPILTRSAVSSSDVDQSICQFNLIIEKSTAAQPALVITPFPSAAPALNASVSSGALPANASLFDTKKSAPASTPSASAAPQQMLFNENLGRGAQGSEVFKLQLVLKILGYFPADAVPTGYYGAMTESAVRKFQEANELEPVGLVGPKTRKALSSVSP